MRAVPTAPVPPRASPPVDPIVAESAPARRGTLITTDYVVATAATLGGIQVLAMLFTLARSKATALILGPTGVGVISLVDQVVSFATQIVALSLPFAAVKFLSAAFSEGTGQFGRVYKAFAWALLSASLIGTSALCAAIVWNPGALGRDLRGYSLVVVLALLSLPATTMVNFFTSALAASGRTTMAGVYGLCNVALLGGLSAVGVIAGGLSGYYFASLLSLCALAVAGAWYLARHEQARLGWPQWGFPELARHRGVAAFAGSLYMTALALPAAHLVARFSLLRSWGLETAGLLQSAMGLGLALSLVMRQSNMLLLTPVMNRTAPVQQKLAEAADYLRIFSLIVGAAALPVVLFPDLCLYVLYSRRFLAAAPYAPMFVFSQVLQLLSGVALGLLVGVDRIATQLSVTLTGLGVLAALAWSLAPSLGIQGVGFAFAGEAVVVFSLSMAMVWRTCRFALLPRSKWAPVAVIAAILLACAASARYRGFSPDVLVIKGVVGAVLLLVIAWLAVRARHREAITAET
jgi:PST family polysaccharide transporter